MKFVIKNGSFVNKETGEAVSALSGKISNIAVYDAENGRQRIRFTFADGNSFSLKKVGDLALKIVRCLYGVADIISESVISFEFAAGDNPDKKNLLIKADDSLLLPCGRVDGYSSEKILLTDRLLAALSRSLNWRKTVVSYLETDSAIAPSGLEETIDSIRSHKENGHIEAIKIKRMVFNNEHALNGYLNGLSCAHEGSLVKFFSGQDADTVWEEYIAPVDSSEEEEEC